MLYSKDRTINDVVRELLRGDWALKSRNKHIRIENRVTHDVITVPFSPSCPRTVQNWLHQVKKSCGVQAAKQC
jgi:hypothetical protein